MKALLISLGIVLPLPPVALFSIYKYQEKLIFFPDILPPDYKFDFNEKFEEINFNTGENITINALLFHAENPRGLIIYFHGNAGALDTWGTVVKDFLPYNYDILIIDYRGYGKSTGKISSEAQLHSDAELVYKEILKRYDGKDIIIYGRSLGSGVACRLAANHPPKFLILETPFYNFKDLAKTYFPFLPANLILKYKFENNLWINQIHCPIFLLHGTKDEVVPYNSSGRLIKLASNIHLTTFDGAGHNNLSDFPLFHETLKNILQ